MHPRHRKNIDGCYSIIASRVDMDLLWPKLLDYEIFTKCNPMLKHWLPSLNDLITKKDIILNIKTSRTQNAYYKLLMSLRDCGYQDEADYLEEFITLTPDSAQSSEILDESLRIDKNVYKKQQKDSKKVAEPETKTKFSVRVQKAKKFRDVCLSPLDFPTYKMRSNPRGMVLIITLIDYGIDKKKRLGAEVDNKNLAQLFEQMGFKVWQCPPYLTGQKIKKKINEFTKKAALKDVDSCFVIISGHGNQCPVKGDIIVGSDYYTQTRRKKERAVVSITEILEFFSTKNCPQLENTPKVFIIQSCRGSLEQRFRNIQRSKKSSNDGDCNGCIADSVIVQNSVVGEYEEPREYENMLVVYATLRGYISYRHGVNGSYFIQIFCEVFMEHACYLPLHDLLNMVDQLMRNRRKLFSQTLVYENIGFNKHLYINPGLTEEYPEDSSS